METGAEMGRKAAKKAAKAGSETRKHGTLVRMADDAAAEGRIAASFRGISLAEFVSEAVRVAAKKVIQEELRKRAKGDKPA